jgi:hypothetical protein
MKEGLPGGTLQRVDRRSELEAQATVIVSGLPRDVVVTGTIALT